MRGVAGTNMIPAPTGTVSVEEVQVVVVVVVVEGNASILISLSVRARRSTRWFTQRCTRAVVVFVNEINILDKAEEKKTVLVSLWTVLHDFQSPHHAGDRDFAKTNRQNSNIQGQVGQ